MIALCIVLREGHAFGPFSDEGTAYAWVSRQSWYREGVSYYQILALEHGGGEVPCGWTRASDRGEVCCECHAEVKAGERIYVNRRGRVFCDFPACGSLMSKEEG